ncbi:MAG: sensor histidine kinase [Nitrospirota bacterium]
MFNSIAGRLVIWVVVTASCGVGALEVFLYERQREASLAMIDEALHSRAELFASLIEIFPDGSVHFEPAEHQDRYPTLFDYQGAGHYYQIFDDAGNVLARSRSLGDWGFDIPYGRLYEPYHGTLVAPDGDRVRVHARRVIVSPLSQSEVVRTFIVTTGSTLRDMERFLALLRTTMLYSAPFIVLLSALGGYVISRASLRPLKRFSDEIGQISEQTLDRRVGEAGINAELRHLAAAFNAMLARIQTVFTQQRRFISAASHELRTPISVIKSYCEVPLRRDRTVEEYKERLRTILRHTEKMSTLIDNLLTLSRLDDRRGSLKEQRVDLNGVVGATVAQVSPLAKQKDIELQCRLATQPVATLGDETALTEVLTNLIDNAIKYTGPGGRITVTVGSDATDAVVTVEDSGMGIPADALPHVFDRFYRADSTRGVKPVDGEHEHAGFGLGLSIVQDLVAAHQGWINVTSEVGKGSVFTVRLQIAASAPTARESSAIP